MQKITRKFFILISATMLFCLASCQLLTFPDSGATEIANTYSSSTPLPLAIDRSGPESTAGISYETFAIETTAGSFAATSQTSPTGESGIEVTAPEGWNTDQNPTFIARFTKGDAFFLVAEESFFSSTDLDTIAEEATVTLLSVFENAQIVGDIENVSVDGQDGRHFIITSTINGVPTTSSYTYIVRNERVYSFVFSQTSDLWPYFSDDEASFLAGISFK